MFKQLAAIVALGVIGVGCSDKPQRYRQERPPVDELDARDRGLQSKDVVAATDQLAQDLIALPELNRSKEQWTVVVDRVENHSSDPHFNYDIFTERLRVKLSEYAQGRIALIENKAKFHELKNRERESEREDYGQGGGTSSGSQGIQPDYALYGKIYELPNRGTSYYMAEFSLSNFQTRRIVWSRAYEVKVAR